MGAIEGLRAIPRDAHVILRSDSKYVVDSMTRNWKRNKNQDLWALLDAEVAQRHVRFEWVRGHSTDETNNRADQLALAGANGTPVPEGALSPKRRRHTVEVDKEIAPRLKHGESIRECKACAAKFVATSNDDYCSHIRCQLEARTR